MAIHVNTRQEYRLHLVVPQLISRLVGSYQHLPGSQGHFGILCLVQGGQICQDVVQVLCKPWLSLEQVILWANQ